MGIGTIESYRDALPAYAAELFKSNGDSRIQTATNLIHSVEAAVGIDFWCTASTEDKLFILDLADATNQGGGMNTGDIVEEMKYIILNNISDTMVNAWSRIAIMSGVFGTGAQREVNARTMDNIRAEIVTDVQLWREKHEDVMQPAVVVEKTNNEQINQMLVIAATADSDMVIEDQNQIIIPSANANTGIENGSPYQTNTIVKELTEDQCKFLECGTTSRQAMALPAVIPGKSNPYQVMALVSGDIIPTENITTEQAEQTEDSDDSIIIDVSAEELREVEEIESKDPEEIEGAIKFGNIVSSGKYAHYCSALMERAIPKRNQGLIKDLRKALIREVNGQEAIALYLMLYNEAANAPYMPGISIFKEMLCKDKLTKRIAGNVSGKFNFLDTFNILTTSSKGWSDFMNLSAVKAFKLDDVYYLMMTEKGANETVAYVDVWGEKCQAKQDGIFEDKQIQNVYMFSEPVMLRENVIIRYLMYWGEQSGLHKGIIISSSFKAEPDRMYNAVFLNETTGKGFINWKLSEAVFKNIAMREGAGFFDKSYEASESYFEKYGKGLEGYTPLNIEVPSQGSAAYRAGRLFGKTVKNIDYAAEVISEAPGKAVEAAKRTVENVKDGVAEAYKDATAGFNEAVEEG